MSMVDIQPSLMALTIASTVVWIGTAYGVLGVVFAIAFVSNGISRVDHGAKGAPWLFRLLILPGAATLWPWMLARWIAASGKAHP